MEPDLVKVDIAITEGSSHVDVDSVRVSALTLPDRREIIRLTPSIVKVTLSGRPELLANLDRNKLMAYVDCSGLQPGPGIGLPVRVQPVSGIEIAAIDPPMIIAEVGTGE
jgi:YbbR domain-containing protein